MNGIIQKFLKISAFSLPVVLPFAFAHALISLGGGPDTEFLVGELRSDNEDDVDRALSYLRKLEREGHAKYVEELLHHPEKDIRKDASFVLGRMKNRYSIEPIVKAWQEGRLDEEDALIALEMIPHPDVLPYFFEQVENEDWVKAIQYPQQGLNMYNYHHPKIRFYSYDDPVYSRMGQLAHSQYEFIGPPEEIPFFELEYRP